MGPETQFKAGAVVATVWNNQKQFNGKPTTYKTISLERNYFKDGKWQNTTTFRLNDLPKASIVLNKAYEYLLMKAPEEAV